MLAFDHAIILTPDVDATAARLLDRHGLATAPGGPHPGHGTANLIVPLGPDYLELMYVADEDEAAGSPIGRWARGGAVRGAHVAALMVRAPSVTPFAERLGLDVAEIRRTRPDGIELSWRLAGLDVAFSDDPMPVFIECRMPPEHHPGRDPAPHRVTPHGIAWVGFPATADRLEGWLGEHHLDIRPAENGAARVAVATDDGAEVIDL